MAVFLRPPAAAGTFYEIDPSLLRKQIDFYFRNVVTKTRKGDSLASLAPHSPYTHSGQVAAHSFASMNKSNFIIIGSNHSPYGADFALMKNSLWKTPIGETLVDDSLANKLLKEAPMVEFDAIPHEDEFSIEVQLPFILHRFGDTKILPILVKNQLPDGIFLDTCRTVGTAISKLMKKESGWKLVGSSDLSKSMSDVTTEGTDKKLLKKIEKLDAKGFFDAVRRSGANMCGYGAIATTLCAAKELGLKNVKVLKYATSAELAEGEVTGYASVIFY
ncbi:MAG: AmmeMemoRadiSam system protein B [Candidatus Aenigmarchaeota archaeon]|nr:AmmeMemoRadiSam system protein B [Candidatus Aenigmarchaeota archaeon]